MSQPRFKYIFILSKENGFNHKVDYVAKATAPPFLQQNLNLSPMVSIALSLFGEDDTVFILRQGSTLRTVVIGANQGEGVYCLGGGCTIENVWFEEACEDAISIKEDAADAVTKIIGGGAFKATDKIIQHNGCGEVEIPGFYAGDYVKCEMCRRNVRMDGVPAYDGGEIVGINIESGDTAKLTNICTDAETPCQLYDGPGDKAGAF
ncbi:hypothetical protein S40285_08595 [Stachybotrys chlorohalonatus IBT 40285]|uniref:Pectate lyase n=1 Tax=Stachybotrys chlorohalonatus (strain IBT 40285) TaxID=1283841 RepID=A0A084QZC9_STAC4|nr:hypothetical protein S40285_08595 [Stachybotrys chlorohalonata IBT 40285]